MNTDSLRTWAEIDLAALRHNLAVAKRYAEGREIMAVVKADAYGHGLVPVVEALADEVRWFGVANVEEGLEVSGHAPGQVFVLGPLLPAERKTAVEHEFVVAISSLEEARGFSALGKEVHVHLAVDSGMGRMGCLEPEAVDLAREIQKLPNLKLEGIATHFPSADEDAEFTAGQIEKIEVLLNQLPETSHVHLSNSAGLLGFQQGQPFATLMRPGLILYGLSPLPDFQSELKPVLALKSRVTLVRRTPSGPRYQLRS